MTQLNPETYAKAAEAAARVKAILEPRILGRRIGELTCSCGGCKIGPAKAIRVTPAGKELQYQDQIGLYYLWYVDMRHDDSKREAGDFDYSTGLSYFIAVDELRTLFQQHFAGIGVPLAG